MIENRLVPASCHTGGANTFPLIGCNVRALNVVLAPNIRARGRQHVKQQNRATEITRQRFFAGLNTDENDLYNLLPTGRYKKAVCVRALRAVHRFYSKLSSLELVRGVWTLIPRLPGWEQQ